jgi:hypothetical protein
LEGFGNDLIVSGGVGLTVPAAIHTITSQILLEELPHTSPRALSVSLSRSVFLYRSRFCSVCFLSFLWFLVAARSLNSEDDEDDR